MINLKWSAHDKWAGSAWRDHTLLHSNARSLVLRRIFCYLWRSSLSASAIFGTPVFWHSSRTVSTKMFQTVPEVCSNGVLNATADPLLLISNASHRWPTSGHMRWQFFELLWVRFDERLVFSLLNTAPGLQNWVCDFELAALGLQHRVCGTKFAAQSLRRKVRLTESC